VSLATPERIRTLQQALYVKAKQEPTRQFHFLYDKVWREDILAHAYARCRANGGAPGVAISMGSNSFSSFYRRLEGDPLQVRPDPMPVDQERFAGLRIQQRAVPGGRRPPGVVVGVAGGSHRAIVADA
jgi:hypothetical protein